MGRRLGIGLAALGVLVGCLTVGTAQQSAADEVAAQTLAVNATLGSDGILEVNSEFNFGAEQAPPSEFEQRIATRRDTYDHGYYAYNITDVAASSGGSALELTTSTDGAYLVVDVDTSGVPVGQAVQLSYRVDGAVTAGAQGEPIVSWRMVQGLDIDVISVSGTLSANAIMSSITCTAGAPGTTDSCQMYAGGTSDYPSPTFQNGALGAGQALNLEVSYPAGAITINEDLKFDWTLDRAFSVNWLTGISSLLVLAAAGGLLYWLHRKYGYDQAAPEPTPIAGFHPMAAGVVEFRVNDAIRPGEIGTVADERVDPIDVTGTLIDLAVRGYLRIHELPNAAHQPLDWRFERLEADEAALRPFERVLLDAVAPVGGALCVSDLSKAVAPVVGSVQSALYDDVVGRGWFERSPDDMRSSWGKIGWISLGVSLLATFLLAAFTTWALLGLSLVIVALALVWVSDRMPRRTAAGAGLLSGLTVLSGVLQTYPTDQFAKNEEYAQISKILPYAVVLGGRDRWLEALAAADDDPGVADPTDLFWYYAPRDWHMASFPASMRSFVTTVQGELFSR